jgi:hypothetical protein
MTKRSLNRFEGACYTVFYVSNNDSARRAYESLSEKMKEGIAERLRIMLNLLKEDVNAMCYDTETLKDLTERAEEFKTALIRKTDKTGYTIEY